MSDFEIRTHRSRGLLASAFLCVYLWIPLFFSPVADAAEGDDPFQFLEESNTRTQTFFTEQAAAARARLDAIPGRAELLDRIRAYARSSVTVSRIDVTATRAFYLKQPQGSAAAVLCMRHGLNGDEQEILDPARLDRQGRAARIDWFVAAPDGKHVALGLSWDGSDDSVLRVLAVDGHRDLGVEIDHARFNRRLAWQSDGKSFYYARYPDSDAPIRRYANVRIYHHVLGRDKAKDEIVFAPGVGGARDVPLAARPYLHIPAESRYAYAVVREGVRRELSVHVAEQRDLASGKPRWHKLAGPEDEILAIEGWKDDLYLLTKSGAPRHRVLRVKASAPSLASAHVVVPQGDVVIDSFALAKDALYMRMMNGGVDRLERVAIGSLGASGSNEYVRTPFDTAITQMIADPRVPGVVLALQGWIEAPVVVQVAARTGDVTKTRLQPPAAVDFSAMDEVRLYAPGTDGVKIPVTLIYRKATRLTGENPTLLVGYGAFGQAVTPAFEAARLAWLERGGIYAIAHVRGGGEYGEPWVQAGARAAKVNTIHDLIAVSEFLVSYGFTNPHRLAIEGTSAGGVAVGGALVRRPDLFAAVVARLPVMDMLRYERMASGPEQAPEFGSAATTEGAAQLRAISAYHQVKDATPYPGVMLTVGTDDARLERWQPGKMAARLQAASTSGKPILLRTDFAPGDPRGRARAAREEELADIYSFLLWQMGDPQFRVAEPAPAATAMPATVPATVAPAAASPAPSSDALPAAPPPGVQKTP